MFGFGKRKIREFEKGMEASAKAFGDKIEHLTSLLTLAKNTKIVLTNMKIGLKDWKMPTKP
jgi:hypothetical protein